VTSYTKAYGAFKVFLLRDEVVTYVTGFRDRDEAESYVRRLCEKDNETYIVVEMKYRIDPPMQPDVRVTRW
jgi:hypothetical protein